MKGYACLLLTLSLAVLGEGFFSVWPLKNSVCPENNGEGPVIIPHKNCSLFYVCALGQERVMECPSDLHYNPKLQICDNPDNAGCEVKPEPEPEPEPEPTKWSVIDLRSQAKDAPFSLLSLIPSNAIKGNNLTYDAALKTIQDFWVKRQEENKKVQTEGPKGLEDGTVSEGADEHKGHGKRTVHVRPGHYNFPPGQGRYPRGTYEAQQQANHNRIFHDIEARLGARPAIYPSGPHADPQGKFRRYLY